MPALPADARIAGGPRRRQHGRPDHLHVFRPLRGTGRDPLVPVRLHHPVQQSRRGGNLSNDHIEIRLGVRDGSAYNTVEEFVEAYADGLRKYKSQLEVRHENGVCYLYEPDGGSYSSSMVTGYYGLGGQILQVEAVTMDLAAHADEAIATSGVPGK